MSLNSNVVYPSSDETNALLLPGTYWDLAGSYRKGEETTLSENRTVQGCVHIPIPSLQKQSELCRVEMITGLSPKRHALSATAVETHHNQPAVPELSWNLNPCLCPPHPSPGLSVSVWEQIK